MMGLEMSVEMAKVRLDEALAFRSTDIPAARNCYIAALQKRVAVCEAALRRIAKWHDEFPMVADTNGVMRSYGFMRGSNGERDFMRKIAQDALDGEEA